MRISRWRWTYSFSMQFSYASVQQKNSKQLSAYFYAVLSDGTTEGNRAAFCMIGTFMPFGLFSTALFRPTRHAYCGQANSPRYQSDREFDSFHQRQIQTQRLLGSVALKPYANCQFDLLIQIESLRLKWLLKLYCLDLSDCFRFCTFNFIQKLQKTSLFPMEMN